VQVHHTKIAGCVRQAPIGVFDGKARKSAPLN